jgi:hypothetical protein
MVSDLKKFVLVTKSEQAEFSKAAIVFKGLRCYRNVKSRHILAICRNPCSAGVGGTEQGNASCQLYSSTKSRRCSAVRALRRRVPPTEPSSRLHLMKYGRGGNIS